MFNTSNTLQQHASQKMVITYMAVTLRAAGSSNGAWAALIVLGHDSSSLAFVSLALPISKIKSQSPSSITKNAVFISFTPAHNRQLRFRAPLTRITSYVNGGGARFGGLGQVLWLVSTSHSWPTAYRTMYSLLAVIFITDHCFLSLIILMVGLVYHMFTLSGLTSSHTALTLYSSIISWHGHRADLPDVTRSKMPRTWGVWATVPGTLVWQLKNMCVCLCCFFKYAYEYRNRAHIAWGRPAFFDAGQHFSRGQSSKPTLYLPS